MKNRTKIIFRIILVGWINSFAINAQTNNDAKQIVMQSKQYMLLKNAKAFVDLDITDKKGRLTKKSMNLTFGYFAGNRKFLIEFVSPEDIKGMKIAIIDSLDTKSEIQMFLPSTGNVQKMNVAQGSFKLPGSEFSIDYLISNIKKDSSFTLKGETSVNGQECFIIQVMNDGLSECAMFYISKTNRLLYKVNTIEKSKIVGEAVFSDYKKVKGADSKYFPGVISVRDLTSRKGSVLTVKDIESISKPDESIYTLSSQTKNTNNKL